MGFEDHQHYPFTSGEHGEAVRSDCFVSITKGKGEVIKLKSKVDSLFGDSIRELCLAVLHHFNVRDVVVEIDDSGALPFVIAARLEAAIQKMAPSGNRYLFPVLPQNKIRTTKEQTRRTRLYLPGNNPKLMINAGIYGSHAIILDLEDSVAPDKKDEARILVRNALCQVDFYGAERMVRINQLPAGLADLNFVVPFHPNMILIPKCETADQVMKVEAEIEKAAGNSDHGIWLMPIIESALGVENAFQIASSSYKVAAIAIGLEDYTADLGVERTSSGEESLYARTRIVNASAAAGIQAIDSVFSEFEDLELLRQNAIRSKRLGFHGMGCIHPAQVKVINDVFIPNEHEIEYALKVAKAFNEAQKEGKNVVALGSKMVDPPVVKRAMRIISEATKAGLIPEREEGL